MDKLFDTVLELSWQAGLIALAVMAVRLVLRKKASRRTVCMLWALVALRLLLPVSLTVESPVSLQAEEAPVSRVPRHAGGEDKRPGGGGSRACGVSGAAAAVVPAEPAAEPVTLRTFARWLPWIWVIGMGCMAAYMLLSFIWMRLTLRESGAHSGQRVPLYPVEHALCAGHHRAVYLCAGERVGGDLPRCWRTSGATSGGGITW